MSKFKDGRYFSPLEVENGDRCGCICPGCEKRLRANHGKGRKEPYFFTKPILTALQDMKQQCIRLLSRLFRITDRLSR